jgi:formate hydrogenlyase transcriptional activator
MEREHILKVLQKTRWKIDGEGGAASILGLHPSTLRFRIKKLDIKRP